MVISHQRSCITNSRFNSIKHFRIRLGRIKEEIRDNIIMIENYLTDRMIADLLIKSVKTSSLLWQII